MRRSTASAVRVWSSPTRCGRSAWRWSSSPLTLALLLGSACAHHLSLQATTEVHGLAGVPLAFGVAEEKVPEGTAVHWTFGDGQEADGPTARHVFAHAGNFSVTEKITDADGVRTAQVPVVVERRSPWMAVPPNAKSAVVFDRFFNRVGTLRTFLSHLVGATNAEAFFDNIQTRLGVDLRNPEAVRAAGLDGDKGLAWVTFSEEQRTGYMVLGTFDDERAMNALRQALTNLGATVSTTADGWTVATAPDTQIHFRVDRGYLIVRVPGEGEPEPPLALGHFAQAPDVGLLSDTAFADARGKVTGDDVQAYFSRTAIVPPGSKPPASPRAGRLLDHLQRVVLGASLHEGELSAEALVQEDAQGVTAASELFAGGGTPVLPSTAPAGAAAYLGFSGDVPYLMELFAGLPAVGTAKRDELSKTFGAHGLDLDRLLALFAGEGAVAAYFDPAEFYRSLVETEMPTPRGDVLVQARVRDPAAAGAAVEKILAEGKAQPGRRELPGGGSRLEFTIDGHPAGAAVVRDQVVLSYGLRHLDDLLEPKAGAARLEPALRANLPVGALGPGRLVLFVDLARMIAQLDETVTVPGLSPQDFFRARLMTGMAVSQFVTLRDLTAILAPDPAGMKATLRVRLR